MTRRRRTVGLAAAGLTVVAAVIAGLVVFAAGGGAEGGRADGPLYSPDGDETTYTMRPGRRMTWGQPVYYNRSKQPIRLIAAKPAKVTAGLRVLGVRAAGVERQLTVGTDDEFPVPDVPGRPVGQVTVPPETTPEGRDGVEFLVGLTATKEGRYVARGLEVTYEHQGQRYREIMPDSTSLCIVAPPTSLNAEDCAFPGTPPGDVE